jgi:hypothetical protein
MADDRSTHLPFAHFLTYRHPFPIGQPVPLDSYITSYLFALGTLITLMMEEARTSETSVDIVLTTWQYIPEDSELLALYDFRTASDIPMNPLRGVITGTNEEDKQNDLRG